MTHLQADTVPMKSIECLRDLKLMNEAVTIDDIYDAYSQVGTLSVETSRAVPVLSENTIPFLSSVWDFDRSLL